jgi:hypothetical protein
VSVPFVRGVGGLLCSNFIETADTLAGSFALSYSIPALISTVPVVTTWNGSKLSHVDFDPGIVEEYLLQLSVDTAPGPDQTMSAKLLKNCAISLSTPLSEIMTSSFAAGVLPKEWFLATVTPLYKSGDKLDPVNYRPVSLTSISCKVMEKIFVKQLLAHMEDNNLIPEQQHGFIPGRSVVTGLLFSTNTWTKTMDNKQPLDIIYLDFSKAFDKVPHDLLLKKLKSRGIDGCLLRWIGAFLANHTFCVRVGKVTSSLRSVVSGVPQGSVLGPILFLLYTRDLLRSIENCYSAYADDIKIFGDPQKTDLQAKLNIVTEWSKKWQIPLNTSKCCVLHCGINNPKLVYFIKGSELLVKKSHNDLGVIVTDTLSWSEQCLAAAGRARRVLYLLKHVFDNPSPDLVSKLYTTYIRPHLEFAIPVWRPNLIKDKNILDRVQHEVTRWNPDLKKLNYELRLEILSLPPLCRRQDRADLIQMFRITHQLFPGCMGDFLEFALDQRLRGHDYKTQKESFKGVVRQSFLTNRTFTLWNGLSPETVNVSTVHAFKRMLDRN